MDGWMDGIIQQTGYVKDEILALRQLSYQVILVVYIFGKKKNPVHKRYPDLDLFF